MNTVGIHNVESEDIQTLIEYFMVSKNLTMDITPELQSYAKESVKYTSSISTELIGEDSNRNTDFDHIPLFSISGKGGIQGNSAFCRISVRHTQPDTLFVSFRPLFIANVEALVKDIPINPVQYFKKYTKRIPMNLTQQTSLDNLMNLVTMLDDSVNGLSPNGLNKALESELLRPDFELTVENWFKTLVRRKAYQYHITGLIEQKSFYCDDKGRIQPGTVRGNKSFLECLLYILRVYKPSKVIFTGFSLGASMAAGASYMCHLALSKDTARVPILPEFHLYQYAGVCIGNMTMSAYIRTHFEKSIYVSLTRKSKELDPVTVIARGMVVPIGNIVNIDVFNHQIYYMNMDEFERLCKVSKITMRQLIVYYLLKMKRSEPFTGIHLAGEDTIERILAKELLDRGLSIQFGTPIPCDYFTSTGYAGKYKICPVKKKQCAVKQERDTKTRRLRNLCVPNMLFS